MATTAARLRVLVDADTGPARVQLAHFTGRMGALGQLLSGVGVLGAKAFASIGLAATGVIGLGVKIASDMQQARIGFTAMLGSAQEADRFLRELADFAARTPFELQGVIEGSQRLLAMGVAAEDVLPVMEAVGNSVAAVGGGAFEIQRVTLALGQMMATGRVLGQDLRQLQQVGIQTADILAEATGTSVAEAQRLQQQGLIRSKDFIDAFVRFTEERLGDMAEAQSKSLVGLISTFKDEVRLRLADVASPLVASFSEAIPKLQEVTLQLLDTIGPAMAEAVSLIADTLLELIPIATPILEALTEALADLLIGLRPLFQGLVPIVVQLSTAFVQLVSALIPLIPPLAEILVAIAPLAPVLAQLAAQVLTALVPALVAVLDPIASILTFLTRLSPALGAFAIALSVVAARLLATAAANRIFGQSLAVTSGLLSTTTASTASFGSNLVAVAGRAGLATTAVLGVISAVQMLSSALRDPITPRETVSIAERLLGTFTRRQVEEPVKAIREAFRVIEAAANPEEIMRLSQEWTEALTEAFVQGALTEEQFLRLARAFNVNQDVVFLNAEALLANAKAQRDAQEATAGLTANLEEQTGAVEKVREAHVRMTEELRRRAQNLAFITGRSFEEVAQGAATAFAAGKEKWEEFQGDILEAVNQWRADMLGAFTGVEGIFDRFAGKAHVSIGNVQRAFEQQVERIHEFREAWDEAMDSGIEGVDRFLAHIATSMGLEGLGFIRAFANANEDMQRSIVKDYNTIFGAASDLVRVIEVDLIGAIRDLIRALGGVPERKRVRFEVVGLEEALRDFRILRELMREPISLPRPSGQGGGTGGSATGSTGTGSHQQAARVVIDREQVFDAQRRAAFAAEP